MKEYPGNIRLAVSTSSFEDQAFLSRKESAMRKIKHKITMAFDFLLLIYLDVIIMVATSLDIQLWDTIWSMNSLDGPLESFLGCSHFQHNRQQFLAWTMQWMHFHLVGTDLRREVAQTGIVWACACAKKRQNKLLSHSSWKAQQENPKELAIVELQRLNDLASVAR